MQNTTDTPRSEALKRDSEAESKQTSLDDFPSRSSRRGLNTGAADCSKNNQKLTAYPSQDEVVEGEIHTATVEFGDRTAIVKDNLVEVNLQQQARHTCKAKVEITDGSSLPPKAVVKEYDLTWLVESERVEQGKMLTANVVPWNGRLVSEITMENKRTLVRCNGKASVPESKREEGERIRGEIIEDVNGSEVGGVNIKPSPGRDLGECGSFPSTDSDNSGGAITPPRRRDSKLPRNVSKF